MGEITQLELPKESPEGPRPERAGRVIDMDKFVAEHMEKVRRTLEGIEPLRGKYRETLERANAALDAIDEQIRVAQEQGAKDLQEALIYNRPDYEELLREVRRKFAEVEALHGALSERLQRFEQHQEKRSKRKAA